MVGQRMKFLYCMSILELQLLYCGSLLLSPICLWICWFFSLWFIIFIARYWSNQFTNLKNLKKRLLWIFFTIFFTDGRKNTAAHKHDKSFICYFLWCIASCNVSPCTNRCNIDSDYEPTFDLTLCSFAEFRASEMEKRRRRRKSIPKFLLGKFYWRKAILLDLSSVL